MATHMMRVREDIHHALQVLAQEERVTMQEILSKALDEYRRQSFWRSANAEFAALRADKQGWREELNERADWDQALLDDLEDDELPTPVVAHADMTGSSPGRT